MSEFEVSLKDYILRILDERDKRYEERFQAQQEAILKAEAATQKRQDASNEIRGAMDDLTRTMIPRVEADAKFASMEEKIDKIDSSVTESAGSGAGVRQAWGWLGGIVALFVSLASLWLIFAPKK